MDNTDGKGEELKPSHNKHLAQYIHQMSTTNPLTRPVPAGSADPYFKRAANVNKQKAEPSRAYTISTHSDIVADISIS